MMTRSEVENFCRRTAGSARVFVVRAAELAPWRILNFERRPGSRTVLVWLARFGETRAEAGWSCLSCSADGLGLDQAAGFSFTVPFWMRPNEPIVCSAFCAPCCEAATDEELIEVTRERFRGSPWGFRIFGSTQEEALAHLRRA